MPEFDTDKCRTELKGCINKKINKATIMWGLTGFLVIIGLVIGIYRSGVAGRQESTKYMIMAESKKVDQKLDNYCTKDKFHELDKNVGELKKDVEHIKNTTDDLKKITDRTLKIMERLERRNIGNNRE